MSVFFKQGPIHEVGWGQDSRMDLRIKVPGAVSQIHKCFEMFGVDGRRVISKVILSSVEGSHLLTPIVCLFDIGVVCFYNMTDIRSDDHYNSDESVPGYSFGR